MENTKDVTIKNYTFRISRMTALVGSKILNILLTATFKNQTPTKNDEADATAFKNSPLEEQAAAVVSSMWIPASTVLSDDIYTYIQKQCLKVCSVLVQDAPLILIGPNGAWAVKELENDMPLVNNLIQEVLTFNLSTFFQESASK